MTGAAGHPDVAAAAGLGQLGAEAERARTSYGEGALIVCDRLVRIYAAEGIEVQALQGLDLLITDGELTAIVGASAFAAHAAGDAVLQIARILFPQSGG